MRIKTAILTGTIALFLAAAGTAVVVLSGLDADSSEAQPPSSVVPAQPAPATPSPTGTPAEEPPSPGELASLESAMAAPQQGEILDYLPLAPGTLPDPEFAGQLAAMQLSVDHSTLAEVVPGAWTVTAVDKDSTSWTIGLVRRESQLTIFSAEQAGNP